MLTCPCCGEEHELLWPSFERPDAWGELDDALKESEFVQATDEMCRIALAPQPGRCFLRCYLPVEVDGYEPKTAWGIWAEVSLENFKAILAWAANPTSDPQPPCPARIANTVLGQPDTLGLPVYLNVDAKARPRLEFPEGVDHPFATMCREGIDIARASHWMHNLP